MSISPESDEPKAVDVTFGDTDFTVILSDGRKLVVPLNWFPRLTKATPECRGNWQLIGDGVGIHWPDVDEDISVSGLLRGRPSVESGS